MAAVDGRFKDVVVMVTGASGMIGSACVAAFLAEGARVVALGHKHRLADGAAIAGIAASDLESDDLLFLKKDLGSDADIESAFVETEERFGPVAVLVNNAAMYGRMAFEDLTREHLMQVYSINVFAPILAARRAARAMIDNDIAGRIVNLSSTSSQQSDPFSVHYDSSKGAIDAATRGMAVALGPHGIRVNAVGPGEMIKSQETDDLRAADDLDAFERRRIPTGSVATPQEVAETILFLSSSAARGINGSIVWVDGGTLGTWSTD